MAPRYLLAPAEATASVLRTRLQALEPIREVESVEDLLVPEGGDGSPPPQPGWVLIPPKVDPAILQELLVRLSSEDGGWSPLLLIEEAGEYFVTPAGPGFRQDLDEVVRVLGADERVTGLLSFRLGMEDLSRIRHDINNSLAAAFAEAQLLMMDVDPDSEIGTSLQAVEAQLRRIRDQVADLAAFRIPRG